MTGSLSDPPEGVKGLPALVLDELLSYQRVPSSYHMIPEESL
jgi:hypothetical protein